MFYEDEDTDVETGPERRNVERNEKYASGNVVHFLVSVNDLRNRTVRSTTTSGLGTFTTSSTI
jgi:hypothetical protein